MGQVTESRQALRSVEVVCSVCGDTYKSFNYNTRYCLKCFVKRLPATTPHTDSEVLKKVRTKEEELRDRYQRENYLALGNGVALEDVRVLLREVKEMRQAEIDEKEEEEWT